jgi:hypothetical protein
MEPGSYPNRVGPGNRSGSASDRLDYFAEFELEHGGTGGNNTFVEQAYVDFWLTPGLGVKIGVSAWKDVGVVLHGFKNLNEDLSVFFDAYTINGLRDGSNLRGSRQYWDNNEDRAMGGNEDFTELVFGFAYYPTNLVALKAEYIVFGEGRRVDETDNNLFGLQAAVKF